MERKLQLSHVLYRTKDLHLAVSRLRNAGFSVEYGTRPEKAYNALIWFENGVFIEICHNSGLPPYIKGLMKLLGYQSVLDRMNKWEICEEGWCEWSLETTEDNLDGQKKLFRRENIPFKSHKAKRKDITGQILHWYVYKK